MTKIFNRAEEKETRKQLRRIMPEAEVILWSKLKGKAAGYKFRRQYSIGRYVIDFYCPALKLAIEVDGDSHFNQEAEDRDKDRQEFMESYGVVFLRFTNRDIYENVDGVLLMIMENIEKLTSPNPSLRRRGL